VELTVQGGKDNISLTVWDGRQGFRREAIEQARLDYGDRRARTELGGSAEIHSEPGKGTLLEVQYPPALRCTQ